MIQVGREEVERLVQQEGAQLVEVLPAEEYGEEHLQGALSIPLKELGDRAGKDLDPARPVVVYCHDTQCDLSPRAARRLETLGFTRVYDYVAGKMDWAAAGLPTEGTALAEPRIGARAHREVPRCHLTDTVSDVGRRIGDWELAVVVDDADMVLGVVRAEVLGAEDGHAVDEAMREGPSTYRPNVPVAELRERFDRYHVARALVSTNDGRLIGLIRRADLDG